MVNERDGEKVKAKKAKWIRKCIHMFDLRPVKMWEFNKCMYPWGNNPPLNSLLLLSHHPTFLSSSSLQLDLRLIFIFVV